ncbi:AGAP003075-PA-like protein [Anopheles sinensis]|uniref:Elongator complex protein 6 n=1 Tax=Anopheles sinensis TaxID=74873 RepID=A0A084W8Y4_ANOSI|nr:AGAP003075-PA-like protein [Anopheles sinensis]
MSHRNMFDCGLALPSDQRRVSLVQERSGVDGGFLLVQLIASHLREDPQNAVLMFASHHTAAHYIGAAQKLTFNARSYIESGKLQLVDVNAELYARCPKLEHTQLLTLLRNRVRDIPDQSNTVVIVDDLSFYTIMDPSAGAEDSVIDFVEELIDKSQPGIGHVVLKVNAAECYERLCATLADRATISILLEPLPSGSFREVDGRMTVHEWRKAEHQSSSDLVLPKVRCNLLYKVGDRQVQTFVPGEFGIKNL